MTNHEEIAVEFLRRLEKNDIEAALGLAGDGFAYWLAGPGTMDKAQFRNFFGPVGEMVRTMQFTITGSTVEGERVALEAQGKADLVNGRVYENRYHFLFELRDGRICAVREYADSAPAVAAFFAP